MTRVSSNLLMARLSLKTRTPNTPHAVPHHPRLLGHTVTSHEEVQRREGERSKKGGRGRKKAGRVKKGQVEEMRKSMDINIIS